MEKMKVRYLDVIISHPDLSAEELEQLIKTAEEESEKMTEWLRIDWSCQSSERRSYEYNKHLEGLK